MKKILSATLAAIMSLSLLASCGGKDDGKINLRVSYGVGELAGEENYDAVFGEFLETHPNVTIEVVQGGEDPSKMMAMIAAGNVPDIIRLSGVKELPSYVQKGLLLELDEYIAKSEVINMDDLSAVNNLFKYDGEVVGQGPIYGVVKDWGADNQLWVNKKIFEEAGVELPSMTEAMTYEELAEKAAKLTKIENGAVDKMGFGLSGVPISMLIETMTQQKYGKSLWNEDFSKTNLDDPEVAEVVEFVYNMQKSGALESELNKLEDPLVSFLEGDVAMCMGGYWISGYLRTNDQVAVDQKDVIFVPGPVANKGDKTSYCYGAIGAGISKTTEHPQEAYELWEYLHFGKPAIERAERGFGLPAVNSLNEKLPEESEFDKQTKQVAVDTGAVVKTDIRINPYVAVESVEATFNKHYTAALYDTVSLSDALVNIDKDLCILSEEGKEIVGK